ncbi:DUF421 domain-containing protein [Salinicoccus sp. HZC-1]|uniref:DUF421 domain-containing protein n=1 Tax=Salinicoccus sp. HZC-1 TaxID=3385497 RepID=UPI00398AAD22
MFPIDVITVKLVLGVIGLLIVTRLLGKKEMSKITPFDFAYSLILGEIIGQTVFDREVSWIAVLYALALWGLLIYLIEVLAVKVDWMRKPLKGNPSILVYQGNVRLKGLKKNKLEIEQLLQMLRKNGVFSLREVNLVVFENDGTVSIIRNREYEKSSPRLPHVIIKEGEIQKKSLEFLGYDQEWVQKQLNRHGNQKSEEILYADWIEGDGLFVQEYGEIRAPEIVL